MTNLIAPNFEKYQITTMKKIESFSSRKISLEKLIPSLYIKPAFTMGSQLLMSRKDAGEGSSTVW